MSLAKSKASTTGSSSIFMTVFENRRKCKILLDKELQAIDRTRYIVMKQYAGERERLEHELSSRILKRSISVSSLNIPQSRWEQVHYWDRVTKEAEDEAKRMAQMEAEKKKIKARGKLK